MALGPRLDLRQSQSLVMTPQLQQAIRLLALSNLELEAYIGEALDHRADLFACGALLYRLLSGRPAFSGTPERVMYQVLNDHLPQSLLFP